MSSMRMSKKTRLISKDKKAATHVKISKTQNISEVTSSTPPRLPKGSQTVPSIWRENIERILITEAEIKRRVGELARDIERDFQGRDLVIAALLNGTVLFLADLIRRLSLPLHLDFIGVSSYRDGTTPSRLIFTKELRLDVRGRDVLLVDDILDTGRTLKSVQAKLRLLKPASLKTCVLLNKPARRKVRVDADFIGFEIPDLFVVGYGLDHAERHRNLPFVGILRHEQRSHSCG